MLCHQWSYRLKWCLLINCQMICYSFMCCCFCIYLLCYAWFGGAIFIPSLTKASIIRSACELAQQQHNRWVNWIRPEETVCFIWLGSNVSNVTSFCPANVKLLWVLHRQLCQDRRPRVHHWSGTSNCILASPCMKLEQSQRLMQMCQTALFMMSLVETYTCNENRKKILESYS